MIPVVVFVLKKKRTGNISQGDIRAIQHLALRFRGNTSDLCPFPRNNIRRVGELCCKYCSVTPSYDDIEYCTTKNKILSFFIDETKQGSHVLV